MALVLYHHSYHHLYVFLLPVRFTTSHWDSPAWTSQGFHRRGRQIQGLVSACLASAIPSVPQIFLWLFPATNLHFWRMFNNFPMIIPAISRHLWGISMQSPRFHQIVCSMLEDRCSNFRAGTMAEALEIEEYSPTAQAAAGTEVSQGPRNLGWEELIAVHGGVRRCKKYGIYDDLRIEPLLVGQPHG